MGYLVWLQTFRALLCIFSSVSTIQTEIENRRFSKGNWAYTNQNGNGLWAADNRDFTIVLDLL